MLIYKGFQRINHFLCINTMSTCAVEHADCGFDSFISRSSKRNHNLSVAGSGYIYNSSGDISDTVSITSLVGPLRGVQKNHFRTKSALPEFCRFRRPRRIRIPILSLRIVFRICNCRFNHPTPTFPLSRRAQAYRARSAVRSRTFLYLLIHIQSLAVAFYLEAVYLIE